MSDYAVKSKVSGMCTLIKGSECGSMPYRKGETSGREIHISAAVVRVILNKGSKTKHAPKSFRVAAYQGIINNIIKEKQSGVAISSRNAP